MRSNLPPSRISPLSYQQLRFESRIGNLETPMDIAFNYSSEAPAVAFHGDCIDLLKAIPDGHVSLIVTSPPYNIGKVYEQRSNVQQYVKWQENIIHECYRTLSKTGSMCWQVGNYVENGSVLPI